MMSNRHRVTPTDDWFDLPSDRSAVGQKKLLELQRQIDSMQTGMKERSELMHKLEILQKIEDDKREVQERVLERNSRNNSPRLLQSEMERIYGVKSQLERNVTPDQERKIIETVIQQRTKEYSAKQQEAALKAKYLDKERQRLQEARQRVQDQRRALMNTMTPDGKKLFSFQNDKVHMAYQPHHAFENKDERIRNSLVLPVKTTEYKCHRWKLKVKYVPMPIEDTTGLLEKYNSAVIEGVDDEEKQDDTVKAFLSFTASKKPPKRYDRVSYVPYSLPEYTTLKEQKVKLRNRLDNKPELTGILKKQAKTKECKANTFQDSVKLCALYDTYRPIDKRPQMVISDHPANYNSKRDVLSNPVDIVTDRYFPPIKRQNSAPIKRKQHKRQKLKFKAVPAEEDSWIYRFRPLGGTL